MGTVHKCRHLDPIKIDRPEFQNWESVTLSCRALALCWAAGTGWLSEASDCQKRSAGNCVGSEERGVGNSNATTRRGDKRRGPR